MSKIKKKMCNMFKIVKDGDSLTYDDLENITGLTRLQISNILNKDGYKVSVERLEQALVSLGWDTEISMCKTCG